VNVWSNISAVWVQKIRGFERTRQQAAIVLLLCTSSISKKSDVWGAVVTSTAVYCSITLATVFIKCDNVQPSIDTRCVGPGR
jgi:hypothetical protein